MNARSAGGPLLWGALAAGAALRFYDLDMHSMWIDEHFTLNSLDSLREAAAQKFHPPLHYVLLWFWTRLFGDSPSGLRSLSALVGTAAIWLGYLVTLEFTGRRAAAVIGAYLFALLPFHVHFAREARMYSLWVTCTLIATLGAVRLARAEKLEGRTVALYLTGLATAQLSHHYAAFYAATMATGVFVLLGRPWVVKRARDLKNWTLIHGVGVAGVVLVAIRWFWLHGSVAEGSSKLLDFASRGGWTIDFKTSGHLVWFRDYAHRPWDDSATTMGLWAVGLCLGAVAMMWSDRAADRKRVLLLGLLLIVPTVAIDLLPIRDYTRLFAPTAAFATIALAYGIWLPVRWLGTPGWAGSAVAAAVLAWSMQVEAAGVYTEEIEPWRTVCSHIHTREQQGDMIFLTATHMLPAFEHCYRGPSPVKTFARAHTVLKHSRGRKRVWLIYTHLYRAEKADLRRSALRSMRRRYRLVGELNAGPILQVYELEQKGTTPNQ